MRNDNDIGRQRFEAARKRKFGPRGTWEDCVVALDLLRKGAPRPFPVIDVVGRLVSAVEIYNERVELNTRAPRVSEIVARLRTVERHARALSRGLADLDDWTLGALRSGGHPSPYVVAAHGGKGRDAERDEELADLSGLPPKKLFADKSAQTEQDEILDLTDEIDSLIRATAAKDEPRAAPLWTERLSALERHAARCASAVARKYGSTKTGVVDRGGRTNIEVHMHGTAYRKLAVEAYMIFKDLGDEATGTTGGPFYRFVEALRRLAAGERGPDHPGPDEEVKAIGRLRRELETRQNALDEILREKTVRIKSGDRAAGDRAAADAYFADLAFRRQRAISNLAQTGIAALSGKKPAVGRNEARQSSVSKSRLQRKGTRLSGKKPPRKS